MFFDVLEQLRIIFWLSGQSLIHNLVADTMRRSRNPVLDWW
jgi:hypothetical protein